MASLLGIGEVILEQARSPALQGGGHLVITGMDGRLSNARFFLSSVLGAPALSGRVTAASPTTLGTVYLIRNDRTVPIDVRGGIPSLEQALGDPETSSIEGWTDAPTDRTWTSPDPGDILRSMDQFHAIPDVPERADSWAEWLYFNGQAGSTRFYLTFLAGPRTESGDRVAGVRLQLDRDGRMTSYSETDEVDEATLLAGAPDLVIGRSRVELDGHRYRLTLDLPLASTSAPERRTTRNQRPDVPRVTGEIVIDPVPGRSLPPLTIEGAGGWMSGYVVPVLSGALSGTIDVGGEVVDLAGGRAYHDHNWGFWEDVSWRWGQVQHGDLSFVYGRVYPPADAADPDRIPGFLGVIGPDGPLGYSTRVSIEEQEAPELGRPQRILVHGRSWQLDLTMEIDIEDAVVTRMDRGGFGGERDFLQLRATYHVTGTVGDEEIDFTAPGSAETFRAR